MKRNFKRLIVFLIGLPIILSGCNMLFDASLYVQTKLNAIYKGDFTKYSSVFDSTEELALTNYINGIKSQVDTFAKIYSMVDSNDITTLNETMIKEVEDIYKEIYAQTFYSVSDKAKTVQNGYEVEVLIKPHKILKECSNEINEFVNQFNSDITSGKYNDQNVYSDDMLNNDIYAKGIIDIIKSKINTPSYDNDKTLKLKVMHNAQKNNFYINTDDLNAFNNEIIELSS